MDYFIRKYIRWIWFIPFLLIGCNYTIPSTSTIRIDGEQTPFPVTQDLLGLALHDSFFMKGDGLFSTEMLVGGDFAINGANMPGWSRTTDSTYLFAGSFMPLNAASGNSLFVSSRHVRNGGVIATGKDGLGIKADQSYQLSFWLKGMSKYPYSLKVSFRDSLNRISCSNTLSIPIAQEWQKITYELTATTTLQNAGLAFRTDTATSFWLDKVSLQPKSVVGNSNNGLRTDMIDAFMQLHPRTVSFNLKGVDLRKVADEGSYLFPLLDICAAMKTKPVCVIGEWIDLKQIIDAFELLNGSIETEGGAIRAQRGHPEPYNVTHVEVDASWKARLIQEACPYLDIVVRKPLSLYTSVSDLMTWHGDENLGSLNHIYYSGYGALSGDGFQGMNKAMAESCFIIKALRSSNEVQRLTYTPLFGTAIKHNKMEVQLTPAYFSLQRFMQDSIVETLPTKVDTWEKPNVSNGKALLRYKGSEFKLQTLKMENSDQEATFKTLKSPMVMGDSLAYNYKVSFVFSMATKLKNWRRQPNVFECSVRDNGLQGEATDYIAWKMTEKGSELYRQVGACRQVLSETSSLFSFNDQMNRASIECKNEKIECYLNEILVHTYKFPALPSLVAVTTRAKNPHHLTLQVVNTSRHEEKTKLEFTGLSVKDEVAIEALVAPLHIETKLDIKMKRSTFKLSTTDHNYKFPPRSITWMRFESK